MNNTLNRLKEYIDFKGISVSAFEKKIGMSNASFGKSLKNGGNIGSDKLENILRIFEEINPTWLLTGNGEMLINPSEKLENQEPPTKEDRLLALIESQQDTIKELSKKIK